MTATNHALTGAVIAVAVDKPILAIPLAFASHFVLDALPHFGEPYEAQARGKIFWVILVVDFILFWSFMVFFGLLVPSHGYLPLLGAIAASSPDLVWAYRFIVKEKLGKLSPPKMNWFNKFHARIQWGERSWGWIFEIAWFIFIFYLAVNNLRIVTPL